MAIRWGVVGCGRIASGRAIPEGIVPAQNARLTGVFDLVQPRAEELGQRFDATVFGSLAELLTSDEVDAVYVATPPGTHQKIVEMAAAHGKHVLCQKPLARNAKEAEAMVAACHGANVKLGVGYMMRFHGAHQRMKEMVQAGAIGNPVAARIRYSVWAPPIPTPDAIGAWIHDPQIAGGGPLMDMGVHTIDLLLQFFGPILEVCGFCDTLTHSYAVEDTCSAMFKFANGAQGVMECYMSVPNFQGRRMIELYGSEGMLVADNTIFQLPGGSLRHFPRTADGVTNAEGIEVEFSQHNMYLTEIERFSAAVEENDTYDIPGEDGLMVQRVADAIYQSSAERRFISL